MSSVMKSLQEAVQHHRSGDLERASTMYRDVIRVDPGHADALHLLGLVAHQRQQYTAAIESINQAITIRPRAALFHCNLGAAYRAQGELQQAVTAFEEAIRLDPQLAEAHYNLSLALRGKNKFGEALAAGQRAVKLNPDNAAAHRNVGAIRNIAGQRQKALDCFLKAIECEPGHCDARYDAATTLMAIGKSEDAIPHFEQVLEAQPQRVEARSWLGRALHDCGRLEEAAAQLQQAMADDPEDVMTYLNLGNAFISSRQLTEAGACFQKIVELDPELLAGWSNLANVLKTQHKCEEAKSAFREVQRLDPDQPLADLWQATLCPLIFQSNEEINAYRTQLAADLDRIADQELRLDLTHFDARASVPPSHIQFHGQNNRPLLERFARVFQLCFDEEPPPPRTEKPKLGVVVTNGHEGVFARCQGDIFERFDTTEFDIYFICSPTGRAALRAEIHNDAIRYITTSHRIEKTVETVRAAEFDVLYFWETGSDVMNYFLPFCRLAPVQCVGPGNSGTSGNPAMDYFLSSQSQEPVDGDEHYSEQLIRLQTLESYQKRVALPTNGKPREDFGFGAAQHLYVCPQKIQKIHPEFDQVLANILRRDGRGVIVLVQDGPGVAAEMLKQRFASSIGDVADRICFLPRLNFDDYISLNAIADVLLDPIHYGGGITLYDWASFNKPLVTWPSQFLRGRYALGFYQKMGIDTCVASTLDEYVDIAVTLGTDTLYRSGIEAQIRAASDVIFEDAAIIAEHQRVFEMLIDMSRS